MTKTTNERFWEKVDKSGDCWEWTAYLNNDGYGRISFGPRDSRTNVYAHRYSYEIAFGKIPDGMHVCHTCDNPSCVNPSHLFIGSQLDNMKDMQRKGRRVDLRGSDKPNSKLCELDVWLIRNIESTNVAMADFFGVSNQLVSRIRKNEVWTHTAQLGTL